MKAGCAQTGKCGGALPLVLACLALGCTSCSESRHDWYDKTAEASDDRTQKIKALEKQGLDRVSATREVDLQGYIKATERGEGVPPLEGAALDNALDQPR